MTEAEFAALVGDRIAHVTPAANLTAIRALGLMPAAVLADRAGRAGLELRRDRPSLLVEGHRVQLNHQQPLLKGRLQDFLDGHTLASWSRQLDARLFFWPQARQAARPFTGSLGQDAVTLEFDSRAFYWALSPDIWLSPINSGNADRRAALRGDWLYVSVSASVEDFRRNRQRRGLVKSQDRVCEISIRRSVGPELLQAMLVS